MSFFNETEEQKAEQALQVAYENARNAWLIANPRPTLDVSEAEFDAAHAALQEWKAAYDASCANW